MRGGSSVDHWVKVVKTMIISTSVRINALCGMVKEGTLEDLAEVQRANVSASQPGGFLS